MNKSIVWFLVVLLIMTTSLTTLESTARFKTTIRSRDVARVARPVIDVTIPNAPADLGQIQPGETKTLDFYIQNESAEYGVSEVSLAYWLQLEPVNQTPSSLQYSLYYFDSNEIAHPITPDGNGQYAGYQEMDTHPQSHHYQLAVTLPLDSILPAEDQLVRIEIQLTAMQTNQ